MYEYGGQALMPLLIVQQNSVHPPQHLLPGGHFPHVTTAWADSGLMRKHIGATARAEPASATRLRNP
jgi:hypothetical protein